MQLESRSNIVSSKLKFNQSVEVSEQGPSLKIADSESGLVIEIDGLTESELRASNDPDLKAKLMGFGLLETEHVSLSSASSNFTYALDRINSINETSPFYRKRSDQNPLVLDRIENLTELEPTSKQDFRANLLDFVLDKAALTRALADGDVEITTTSGTTDDSVQALSDLTISRVPDDYVGFWNLPMYSRPPRTAVFTSPECLGRFCQISDTTVDDRISSEHTLFVKSTRDVFAMSAAEAYVILEEIQTFEADWLFVNPVYLHCLIKAAQAARLKLPSVDLILCSYQYMSKIQERAIKTAFPDARVVRYYSATELSGCQIALECHQGHVHVRSEQCLVEIEDTDDLFWGNDCAIGQILVSNFASNYAPLLRYRVGDIGCIRQEDDACTCGGDINLEIHGRLKDCLFLRNSANEPVCAVTTKQFDDVVSDVPGIEFYRASQVDYQTIELEVVTKDEQFRSAKLEEVLRDVFGFRAVKLLVQNRISPEMSNKFRLTGRNFDGE